MGIFRITKSEFIKIFKKSSVYVMGILLAAVITLSAFAFSPSPSYTYSASVAGSSVGEIHTNWLGVHGADTKINLDQNFSKAQEFIDYYSNYNTRETEISQSLNNFTASIQILISNVNNSAAPETLSLNYAQVKEKLTELINSYTNEYGLAGYSLYAIYLESPNYLSFYNNQPSNLGLLNKLFNETQTITSPELFKEYYVENQIQTKLNKITDPIISSLIKVYANNFSSLLAQYTTLINQSATSTFDPNLEVYRGKLYDEVAQLETLLTSIENSKHHNLLIEQRHFNEIVGTIEEVKSQLFSITQGNPTNLFTAHKELVKKLNTAQVGAKLTSFANSVVQFTLSGEFIEDVANKLNENVASLKTELLNKITDFASENSSSTLNSKVSEFKGLITNYKALSDITQTYVSNLINLEIVNDFSASEILRLQGFEKFNTYEANEFNLKMQHYLETKSFPSDYATVFAYDLNSSSQTSVYDFMFYAMKIASVLIVVFAIIMASNIIAYEFDTGTIKLVAIRPFKRYKILLGKLLAVLFFVIIFVLFSALISFIGGIAQFPLVNTTVLAVFNAGVAFTIHPALLMLINIVSLIAEISFYVIIAISLSTVFRSFAVAMTSSMLSYLLALVLNITLSGMLWYSYVPFSNVNLFKYMGGTFVVTTKNTLFTQLFSSTLFSNSNFFISLGIITLFSLIMWVISWQTMKRRDI